MEETYCLKDKRYTPCVEPRGYQKDKRGRTQFFFYCTCAVCGSNKVKYVKKTDKSELEEKLEKEGKQRESQKTN